MRGLFLVLLMLPTLVQAEVPKVATDIAPVHSIVAQVMKGVGVPKLVIPPNASPHGYAMRPSEARSLSAADLVVWIGPALTPWLAGPLETLAGDAKTLTLMDVPEMTLLPFREGAAFEGHDHAEEDHEEKGHEEGDHEEHDHEEEGHEEDEHDGNDHGGHGTAETAFDPHLWLDPANGAKMMQAVARTLGEMDPTNAQLYQDNAAEGVSQLAALTLDIDALVDGLSGQPFIVFHDAFHYFEARFEVEAIGAIALGDAATPGALRIAELRAHVAEAGAVCAFAEPQMNTSLMHTVIERQGTRPAQLDPLGSSLPAGAELYSELLRAMAQQMAACLSP